MASYYFLPFNRFSIQIAPLSIQLWDQSVCINPYVATFLFLTRKFDSADNQGLDGEFWRFCSRIIMELSCNREQIVYLQNQSLSPTEEGVCLPRIPLLLEFTVPNSKYQ